MRPNSGDQQGPTTACEATNNELLQRPDNDLHLAINELTSDPQLLGDVWFSEPEKKEWSGLHLGRNLLWVTL